MRSPLVSIPIIVYNHANFIKESVLSAVEQNYDNLQVVVCDDASTDGTQEILLDLSAKYPERLEVHFNKNNLGPAKNRTKVFLYQKEST